MRKFFISARAGFPCFRIWTFGPLAIWIWRTHFVFWIWTTRVYPLDATTADLLVSNPVAPAQLPAAAALVAAAMVPPCRRGDRRKCHRESRKLPQQPDLRAYAPDIRNAPVVLPPHNRKVQVRFGRLKATQRHDANQLPEPVVGNPGNGPFLPAIGWFPVRLPDMQGNDGRIHALKTPER